jgi:hypothetical protein
VKLGISGTPEEVDKVTRDLLEKLQRLGLQWRSEG